MGSTILFGGGSGRGGECGCCISSALTEAQDCGGSLERSKRMSLRERADREGERKGT